MTMEVEFTPRARRPRPKVVTLSDAAAERVREIMARAETPYAGLRVGVKNGGCAGQEYVLEYADKADPLDEVVEDKGVRILDRAQGGAVPDRHRGRLRGDQARLQIRLPQSQPDRCLRLRRKRDHQPRGGRRLVAAAG